MKEKLLKIVNYFTLRKQLRKLSEEVYELQEAIIRYGMTRGDSKDNKKLLDDIKGEMADCYVVLGQIKAKFNFSNEEINEIMNFKVDRTIYLIENNYFHELDKLSLMKDQYKRK